MVVWDDAANTCGNPAPVIDEQSGAVVLLSTWNRGTDHEKDIVSQLSGDTRRVFTLSSSDDGITWTAPREITPQVKKSNWTWYATGPGRGIQLSRGKHKGRLVIPCNHMEAVTKKNYSHVIWSDDHGKHWTLGGTTPQDKTNEATIAELSGGQLMLNMRNTAKTGSRLVAISKNAGRKWLAVYTDTTLVEPGCEGNLLRYSSPAGGECLVFSNPASATARVGLTVRISYDNGKTWPLKKLLYEGPSAYSCLTVLPGGQLACAYEAGVRKPYEGIVFDVFSITGFITTP